MLVPQSYLILCNSRDYSLPDSYVHEFLQARILEWVAIPFSRRSSWPRDWTQISNCKQILYLWAIREVSYLPVDITNSHFPPVSVVKNPPATQETWVQSLRQEGPLEKEMATHYNFLAWEILWERSLFGCCLWGHKRARGDLAIKQKQLTSILQNTSVF